MPGIVGTRKIQLGQEATAGTPVAASTIWRGKGTLEDRREVRYVEEDVGYLSGIDRVVTPKLLGALAMDSVEATYHQLPYILSAGIDGVVSGAADGAGSGRVYTYTCPTTTKPTLKFYTIQGGDDQEAERMEYSFVEDFTLEGKAGESLMMSANWLGRQIAVNAFTAALAVPTVDDILFQNSTLAIDAIGGTIGATPASNTYLALTLKYKTGWVPVWTGDGNKYFSFAKITKPECEFTVTFEHDAVGAARKVDWRAETARLVRMQWLGATWGTGGTTYTRNTLRIDCAAKISKVSKLDEINGNDVLQVTFVPKYNATAARFLSFVCAVDNYTVLP